MLYNNDDISYKKEDLHFNDLSTDFNLTREQFDQLGITVYSYEEFNAFGNLKNISYDDFVSRFEVYPTYNKARKIVSDRKKENPDYYAECHHIIEVSNQIKEFNKLNNTSYSPRDKKKFYREQKGNFDDRCIIVTSFEHILAHALLAFKYGGEYISHFYTIIQFNKIYDNKSLLGLLFEYSSLRVKALKEFSESHKNWYKNLTPEEKDIISKKHKAPYENLSEEEYNELCKQRKETANQPGVLEKLSKARKGKLLWNNGQIEICSDTQPGPNFVRGYLPNHKPRGKGYKTWNNGEKETKLPEGVVPQEPGWQLGILPSKRKTLNYNKGKIYITDGIKNKMIFPDEKIPQGWYKGCTHKVIKTNKGKVIFNNGKENKYFFPKEAPDGWSRGLI